MASDVHVAPELVVCIREQLILAVERQCDLRIHAVFSLSIYTSAISCFHICTGMVADAYSTCSPRRSVNTAALHDVVVHEGIFPIEPYFVGCRCDDGSCC